MDFVSADGSFACEVKNTALWETPTGDDAQAIREAYREHGVLVFRRQSLSERELLDFGRLIGNPSIYAETHWLSTYDEVIILSNMRGQDGEPLGGLANKGLTWHTDQSYYAEPVTGCFLYGVEVPANGGGTRWASLYRAYEELSNSMKNTIDALVGTFSYYARAGSVTKEDDNHDRARRIGKTPEVKHPPVNMNPVTGRRFTSIPAPMSVWKACPRTKPTAYWTSYSHIWSDRKISTNTIGGRAIWCFGTMRSPSTPGMHFQTKRTAWLSA